MRLERLTSSDLPVSVGPWTLVVAIGERDTGRVFRAESDGRGGLPRVADLTVISPVLLTGPGTRDEILAELGLARALVHPGVVRTYGCGEHRGVPWYVTEPEQGVTLQQIVDGVGPMSPRQALDLGVQVVAALAHGHAGAGGPPLIHRGLRPSRVLVGSDGKVKLRGFGLGGLPSSVGRNQGTEGTPWESPEQIGRRRLGPGSDLFSLGALLYYTITGRNPFRVEPGAIPSERVGEIVRVLARGEIFRRLDRRAQGLGGLFQRLLAVDPSARHTDGGMAEQAMRQVRRGLRTGPGLGTLATRVAADHAGTVAVGGAEPSAAPGLPIGYPSAPTVPPAKAPLLDDDEPTDADFDLPSSQPRVPGRTRGPVIAGTVLPEELAGTIQPDDLEETRSAPNMPAVRASNRSAPVPAPRPAPRPAPAAAPRPAPAPAPRPAPVAAPRPAPVAAPRPAPAPAPRPAPVAAPRPAPVAAPRPAPPPAPPRPAPAARSSAPAWAPPAAPAGPARGAPAQSAPKIRSSSSSVRASGAAQVARRPPPGPPPPQPTDEDEGQGSGRLLMVLAGVVIVAGILGLFLLQASNELPETAAMDLPEPPTAAAVKPAPPPVAPPEPVEPVEPVTEEAIAAVPDETPGVAVPAEPPTSDEVLTPTPAPTPRPPPVTGPVELSLRHRPLAEGEAGASELVSVRIDAPADTRVTLTWGPEGGPYSSMPLRGKSGGRWEEWLSLPANASAVEYWIVAEHPAAKSPGRSGSESSPHRISLK